MNNKGNTIPGGWKAIIVDDERNAREVLQMLIEKHTPQIKIAEVCKSAGDAIEAINAWKPELIFLDVEMPRMNGFEMLNHFNEINFEVIFTTAFDQYAINAIKISALDYLLKPINPTDLKAAVAKFENKKNKSESTIQLKDLLQNLKQTHSNNNRIALPTFEGLAFVEINDIVRCESDSNYTKIFTAAGKEFMVSKTLGDFEEMLSEYGFFRVHHSHLVNLSKMLKYTKGDGGYITMNDNKVVEVSSRKKKDFLNALKKVE